MNAPSMSRLGDDFIFSGGGGLVVGIRERLAKRKEEPFNQFRMTFNIAGLLKSQFELPSEPWFNAQKSKVRSA